MQIQHTKSYEIFSFLDHNRPINVKKLEKLRKAIEKKNKLHVNPIIVNSQMQVVEGQHRLMAARALGVDIYYMVDDTYEIEDIITLNTLRDNWSVHQYIDTFASMGNESYIFLKHLFSIVEDGSAPFSYVTRIIECLGSSRGTHGLSFEIRSGKLEIKNRTMVESFILITTTRIRDVNRLIFEYNKKNGIKLFYGSCFVSCLCNCYKAMSSLQYDELWGCIFRDYQRFVSTGQVHRVVSMFDQSYNKKKSAHRFDFDKVTAEKGKKIKMYDGFDFDD